MKANLEYNLPEDQEQFNVASKGMEWALLAWDLDQKMRSLLKYDPEKYKTGEQALEHIKDELRDLMEERGLQFPA
jgi:uncharacterized protein YllA (UPF0747 family)|tara:strand:+ start:335 stop:559 length:225 start_codon:yes stop_codon:yes gene_type:complete